MAKGLPPAWTFDWRLGEPCLSEPENLREWQALVAANPAARVFQEPTVVRIWFETRGRHFGLTPALLWARRGDGARAIIPFGIGPSRWTNGFRRRAVAAGEPNFDYQDPAAVWADGRPDWASLWSALADELRTQRLFEVAVLRRLSAEVAPAEAEADPAVASPVIPLDRWREPEELLATLGANLRVDVRRRLRRLGEAGRVECVVFDARDPAAAHAELGRLREAYAREWAGTAAASDFGSESMGQFYRRLLDELLPVGWLHFSALQLNGRSIAWVFGFLYRGVYHYYKPVYDPEFADYSPGKVLCWHLIERGLREGWRQFDFGAGVESYKLQWTAERVELRQISWTALTLRSRLCRALRRALGKPW